MEISHTPLQFNQSIVKLQVVMKEKVISDVFKYNGLYAWQVNERQAI